MLFLQKEERKKRKQVILTLWYQEVAQSNSCVKANKKKKKKEGKGWGNTRWPARARTRPSNPVSGHVLLARMCVATFCLWLMSRVDIRWLEMIPRNSPRAAILHLRTWGEKKREKAQCIYLKGQHSQADLLLFWHSQPRNRWRAYLVFVDEARRLSNKRPGCRQDSLLDMNLACGVQLKVRNRHWFSYLCS